MISEDVFIKPRSGEIYFDQASPDCEDEVTERKALPDEEKEGKTDDCVEEKPKSGIDGVIIKGGVRINPRINVVVLEPGKGKEKSGEEKVDRKEEKFHRNGIVS